MEISNKEIRKWIELALKQRNNIQMRVMNEHTWSLNVHLRNIYNNPSIWFELQVVNSDKQCIEYANFTSDIKSGSIYSTPQNTLSQSIPKNIVQKIKDINEIFLEELTIDNYEQEILRYIPYKLYHATFRTRLYSIRNQGILPGNKKTHDISDTEVVYLATDPYKAANFCKEIRGTQKSSIIVFEVDRFDLNHKLIGVDRNRKAENSMECTYTYRGTIRPAYLTVVKSDSPDIKIVGKLKDIKKVPTF